VKVTVIGDGGWGTALAMVLVRNDHKVTVWGPFPEYIEQIKSAGKNSIYLPGVEIPPEIRWTADLVKAVDGAELVVLVVPSRYFRSVAEKLKDKIPQGALIVSATKGLDEQTHERMSVVAESILGRPVAVLSGPSHAEEVARGIPCAVVVAARDMAMAAKIQAVFMNETFRVYTLNDVIGVELGGALKNVIALAAGISDGMGYGDNSKAALMTRGIIEITRLGVALGAKPETFSGLSGIGDLMVTCMSRHSRNRGVGERLGKGENIQQIMDSMQQVAEGVWNCRAAKELANELGVSVPITEQVYEVVHNGKNPRQAVRDLMTRSAKPEWE